MKQPNIYCKHHETLKMSCNSKPDTALIYRHHFVIYETI